MKTKTMLDRDPAKARAYMYAIGAVQALTEDLRAESDAIGDAELFAVRLFEDNDDEALAMEVSMVERLTGMTIDLVRAAKGDKVAELSDTDDWAPYHLHYKRTRAVISSLRDEETAGTISPHQPG